MGDVVLDRRAGPMLDLGGDEHGGEDGTAQHEHPLIGPTSYSAPSLGSKKKPRYVAPGSSPTTVTGLPHGVGKAGRGR